MAIVLLFLLDFLALLAIAFLLIEITQNSGNRTVVFSLSSLLCVVYALEEFIKKSLVRKTFAFHSPSQSKVSLSQLTKNDRDVLESMAQNIKI